jgi:hypothetical protein
MRWDEQLQIWNGSFGERLLKVDATPRQFGTWSEAMPEYWEPSDLIVELDVTAVTDS